MPKLAQNLLALAVAVLVAGTSLTAITTDVSDRLADALEDAKALQEANARYRRQLPDTAHLLRLLKSPHPAIISTIIAHEDVPDEVLAEIARTPRFDHLLL